MIETQEQLVALALAGQCRGLLPKAEWLKQVDDDTRHSMEQLQWVAFDPMSSNVRLTNTGIKLVMDHLEGFVTTVEVVQLSQGPPHPFGAFTVNSVPLDIKLEEIKDRPHVRAKKVFDQIILHPDDEFSVIHSLGAYMPVLCIMENITPPFGEDDDEAEEEHRVVS